MADPQSYRPASGTIPDAPGVYRWRDERRQVIYVGKAKSLRSRLNSYFQDIDALHPRTRQMLRTAGSLEWTVVQTEVEALQLEYSWIKEYNPRFNVKYRDDKSYPSLAVTLSEEVPRLQVMRGPKRKGVRYFGPYPHAWAIRETLDLLLRVFPARTCSKGVFVRHGQMGRPCLLGYIDKCSAPCVGNISVSDHRQIVADFCEFMAGNSATFLRRLESQMAQAAQAQDYERAARLRDDIGALRRAMEKQAVVFTDATDADVIGVAEDELEAAIGIFYVRGGRVRGQRGFVVDKVEDLNTAELVGQFLSQAYDDPTDLPEQLPSCAAPEGLSRRTTDDVPREVLVPALPPDAEALTLWLRGLRGANVSLRVPQRGDKRALMATVERNAAHAFALHKTKRANDLTARSLALSELQEALNLDVAPLRIECFDVSALQGTNVVASMVVFEDGLARTTEYRRFAVHGKDGNDDTAAMREVIRRRFARYLSEKVSGQQADPRHDDLFAQAPVTDPDTGRARKFAYPPQLVVVDGGLPQVGAAAAALDELGIVDVAVCGLAKRLEEVWLPGQSDPVILSRTSEALYLLQRVRDEAHRFAISYHRSKRSSSMTESALDGIAGLGATRRKAVLRHFGSLKRLRAAGVEQIMEVPGVGRGTAEAVAAALAIPQSGAPTPAFDPATGEIITDEPVGGTTR